MPPHGLQNATTTTTQKTARRIIIDTDCGTDDAVAILLAVRAAEKLAGQGGPSIEAITTVAGNVELAKVRPNVLRVLRLCGDQAKDIPVYEGASCPIVEPFRDACYQHGNDGFGGVAESYPPLDAVETPAPQEHAVNALIRLVRRYPGEIRLVALGPLTNVALAQRLDPSFLDNLHDLVVMGGSCTGSGNDSPGAEFNFGCDPEAVAVAVDGTRDAGKLTIVTFDACRNHALDWAWYDALDAAGESKYIRFVKEIMAAAATRWRAVGHPGIYVYDMSAMAVVFDPLVAAKSIVCPVYPELTGRWSRGAIVLDRRTSDRWDKKPNATVVSDLNTDRLKAMYQLIM